MDDVYDDLDNYEDLNIVEELKKENHDLKLKLEEYTNAMSKLQKDFDKLSSDFKKLEMNYSSLLKTAKVEIERKTKIITDLNIEKDMIVINALQKRNINEYRKLQSITKPFMKGPSNDSSFGKVRSNVSLTDNNNENNANIGRKEDIRFSSVDTTTTSGNTDIASKLMQFANNNSDNVKLWSDRTSDTKENRTQRNKNVEHIKSTKPQALSIKNRRKSMPAASFRSHVKYSSDEENEDRFCTNEKTLRDEPKRQHINKVQSDRQRYKAIEERNITSETSNVDDKYYGYNERSRDMYHWSKNDRHYGIDKHRHKNKYDISLRHRRHFSPERSWRASRNNDCQRQEYGRYRVLESPPPDKFKHYHLRNHDMRYKRDRDDTYDLVKKDNHYDKYSTKQKTNNEPYDEPISKRLRTNSFNKLSEEDMRWSRERQLEQPILDIYENLHQDLSCQSPDYIVTDAVTSHPVKEIRNTASTPQEDPRIHSNRYILKTSDDNVALSTVIGRNIDLKKLDTSLWNNRPSEVPKPLTRRPSQCSEEFVKDIYMDIDKPVSNMSTESGEILSYDAEDNLDVISKVPNESNTQLNVRKDPENLPDKNDDGNSLAKYKIPKVTRNESDNKCSTSRDIGIQKTVNKTEPRVHKLKDKKKQIQPPSNQEPPSQPEICRNDTATNKGNYSESSTRMKEIIAGDLELSDETCDNLEIPKNSTTEKSQNEVADRLLKNNIEQEIILDKLNDIVQDDVCRKKNSKKKLLKNKETPKNTKMDADDSDVVKKAKSKKDTKDSKEIKTKFTELFGESSSLITPEDLGIMAVKVQTQSSASYVPICEDAQDAVDITTSKLEKVQTRLSKLRALETAQTNESLEAASDVHKTGSKTKTKSFNDNKKKSKKEKAESTDKSKIREVYEILTADKIVTQTDVSSKNTQENETVEQIVTETIEEKPKKVSRSQEPCETVSEVNNFSKEPQVGKHTVITSNIDLLPKPNILTSALATSTPQKELKQDMPGIEVVVRGQTFPNSSKDTSCGNVTADKSSNSETLNSQNDTDVPDVRIFVTRKRRGKMSKKPIA